MVVVVMVVVVVVTSAVVVAAVGDSNTINMTRSGFTPKTSKQTNNGHPFPKRKHHKKKKKKKPN